jgi:transposase InsO family protein
VRPEDYLDGHAIARSVYERVRRRLSELGPFETRTSKSQIAFRRRRGFAYLWLPGQYLRGPHADVVLSIALDRHDPSPRFKEVVQPTPGRWMHHLELGSADQVDAEVVEWLEEAASQAD